LNAHKSEGLNASPHNQRNGLPNCSVRTYDAGMQRKMRRLLWQIRDVRGLSADEKILFARSLSGTPDERWRLHENFLRSHGLYTRSSRKAYGFK
jgi:hypothetical protein